MVTTQQEPKPEADLPEAVHKVEGELSALNSLITVLVVVFIILVVLQIIQTILKVMKPKHKKGERECKPHAVVVHSGSSSKGSKKESRSRKDSSSRRSGSLPSRRLSTKLTLSTESECEKSVKSSSKEVCTGSREECFTPTGGHPAAFKRPSSSSSSVPALEMSKEMAASLKMLNCGDVVNTPLPSTAPLAVPHTPSKSKSNSKESIEDSAGKDKKKDSSPPKTAPTQPNNSAPQITPVTPVKAPVHTNAAAPAPPATPAAAALTTATIASPGVQSTQRASVVESITTGPKKNSPVKTAREEVKEAPPPSAPAPATAPPQ